MNALSISSLPVSPIIVERLGWVLVHSLWQFALMALLAAVALRVLCRHSAAARYTVLGVAMLGTIAIPGVTWSLLPDSSVEDAELRVVAGLEPELEPASDASFPGSESLLPNDPIEAGAELDDAPAIDPGSQVALAEQAVSGEPSALAADVSADVESSWSGRLRSALQPWLAWIVGAWLGGVLLCSTRPLLGWCMLWRLRRVGVSPVSDDVLASLKRVSDRLGMRHGTRVLHSTLATVPVVVGYFRPVILLPLSLVTNLPAAQLEAILAHELAHVQRHDFVVNLLQTLIETFFFYHPAVWWLSNRLRAERENCCDDLVVTVLGNRAEYGRALVAVEELRGCSSGLALSASDGSLLERIRRLAGIRSERAAVDRWTAALFALAIISAALSMSLGLAAKDGPAQPPSPALATLPDGVIVELIGVAHHTSRHEAALEWWTPSGTPLAIGPAVSDGFLGSVALENHRLFAVQMRGLPDDVYGQVSISLPEGKTPNGFSTWGQTHRSIGDSHAMNITTAGPITGPGRGSVQVRLAIDEWGPIQKIDSSGVAVNDLVLSSPYAKCYQNVRPEHVKETRSQAVLTLLWPRSQDELATYEVVAVDHDGQRHAVVGTAGPTNRREFTFPIALARISHFEYRLRPYRHVVTFENVSMETRFLTDLLVKTVSLPAPVLDAGETPSTAEVRHPEKRDQLPAQVGPGHRLEHVVWSHDSLQAFGTGDFNTLVSWQQNESEWVPTSIQMSHHANSITVSSKSPLVVVGTNVGTAEVWDATTQERQCELRSSPQWSVYAVAISADEKLVAACGTDGTVAVFDRVSKELIVRLGEKAETRMSSLAFSPDGTTLAAMDRYGVLVLWSVPQGERLAEWKNVGGESHSVYWSRDGRQVAVNGWGKVTLIAAEMGSVPRDVTAPDEAVTKSPELDDSGLRRSGIKFGGFTYASLTAIPSDIRMAASIAPDASLLIWDLATRKIVQTLPAPAADVISKDSAGNGLRNLVFSPDGQRVACTTIRGDVVFWQLAQAEAPQGQNDAGIPVEPTAVASATAPSARLNIKYDMPGAEAETRLFVERIDPAFYAEHGRRDEYGPEEYGGIRFSRLKNGDSLALENLRAGTYVVARYRLVDIVREGTGKASSSVYLDGQWIELGEKETKSVSVSRPSGQAISGRVVVPADLKLNTLVVHVCSRNAHTSGSLNHRDVLHFDALNPDSDHTFKTEELIPGQYKVIVDGYANHSLAVSGIILPSWAGTAHVTVPASGKPPAIEVTLRDFDRDEWLKDQRAEQEKTRTLREPAFVLPDHLNVMAVGFGGDGKELVSVATERAVTIRTWDVVEQKLKREVKLDSDRHGNFFLTGRLQLSADGRRVAAIVSGQVGVWDAVTGKLVNMLELPEELEHGFLRGLTITPDLSLIAVGRTPGLSGFSPPHAHGIVWDVASGKVLQTVQHDNAVQVQSIALSHDGKWLATGGQQAGTFVWEVSTGKRLVALPNENPDRTHPDPEIKEPVASQVLCLAFSPNDRRLAIGDMLGVKLVDAASGRLEHRLDAPFRLGRSGLVFSQDGQLLARTATDEVVPIWSTKTGRLVAEIHSEAHDGAFSDDGRWFATGFTDKQKGLAVWQLRDDPLAAANDGNANDGPEGTLDTEADDVVVSWVQRGSVKFGGIEPRTLLVIRKDGSAIVPANHRERESRTKLRQDDVANLLKQLVDDCDIESIEGLWFNGKPNFWSGSQDTLFVRRGDRTIRLTCEYGWPSGTEQTDLKIQNFTAASRVVGHFKSLIRAGGRDAVAKALPIANRSLQQHFPKVELLTVDDFRWGENFPDGHRRLTFHRERQVQGEPENVRVEVLVPDEGESRPGDVTVNKQRVQPVAVNVKPADGNSRPPVTQTLQPAVPASEVFSEVVELLSADDLAVKDVSDINDPDVLLDQLEKGPRVSHFLMTGGGIFWQPGTPPQAMYVTLWNQRFASGKQVDPRVRQLINLGEAARSKVQQRLLKAKPQVASHLALVLRSTGNAESIPVLIQLLKRLSQQTGATRGGSSTNTSFVLTSALWKLTGRRHSFTPEQWEQWWNGVRQDFSVARDRQTPEFKSLVTAERVRQIVSQLSDQEVSARNRLIELGPAAVEHLIATLKGELTQHPDDADSKPGEARSLSMRLAWVIDELGATKRQAPSSSRTAGK